MTRLYSIGFVDPELWVDGRFPSVFELFARDIHPKVRRDLEDLTLGPVSRRLSLVRPRHARLNVRFLTDRHGVPIVAFAAIDFAGTGYAAELEDVELPIRHEGRYTMRRSHGRWRIVAYDVRGRVPSLDDVRRRVREAAASPELPQRNLLFVLVIGSDARPGQSVSRTRADSLHIVGVNPRHGVASILGIPRDSFVRIPGVGTRKINEALFRGGPDLMVRTVERLTGVRIDAYVLTGFDGFREVVDGVGGIRVDIPYRMSDPFSRAHFRKGPIRLFGRGALAFSRNRHDAPGGDFGRSLNQGRLLLAALRELRADVRKDPLAMLRWLAAGAADLRSDLSLTEMTDLLLAIPSIEPRDVENRVVSGHGATVGGLSIVRLGSRAHTMFRDIARDAAFGSPW
jgi:LCP family protein required for cell wall assembly